MYKTKNDFYDAVMDASFCVVQKIKEALNQRDLYCVCCKFFLVGLLGGSQNKIGFSFEVDVPYSRLLQTPFVLGRVYPDYLGKCFSHQYVFEYENLRMDVERNSDGVECLKNEISGGLVELELISFEIITQDERGNYTNFVLDNVPCPDGPVHVHLRPSEPFAKC